MATVERRNTETDEKHSLSSLIREGRSALPLVQGSTTKSTG